MKAKSCIECGVETSAYIGKNLRCTMCLSDRRILAKSERIAATRTPRKYKPKKLERPVKMPSLRMKKFLVTLPPEKLEEIQNLAEIEGMPYTLWVRAAVYHYADFKRKEKERLENFYKEQAE